MDDEKYLPAEDATRPGGELIGHELAHVAQQGESEPDESEPEGDGETFGDDVVHVVESAAELGFGAVIGPFTGGETVNIVGSVASMLEAGVDRLTHLGEHESAPGADADADADRGGAPDDGSE
jgi:hypothetical protein